MAKPKTIPRPPARYYDPALDTNLRATNRGLRDLREDTELRDRPRLLEDYRTQTGDINRQSGRTLEDLVTDRTRSNENYARNLSQLQRQYTQLGNAQAQTTAASGTASGGALAASAVKRNANQANEKVDIDTTHTREQTDIGTQTKRTGEDTTEATKLADRGFARSGVDLTDILTRAQREGRIFKADTADRRYQQAVQGNWKPPGKPKKGKGKGKGKGK